MANKFHNIDRFRRAEVFFADLIKKSVAGTLVESDENVPVLMRATVLAVDVVGGLLENPDGAGQVSHRVGTQDVSYKALVGPANPRGSIKARVITGGFDQFFSDGEARVFWPFFPEHMQAPVKPGEHVYVMFEDRDCLHGLWLAKVSGHENVNFFRGESSFQSSADSSLAARFGLRPEAPEDDSVNNDRAAGESLIQGDRLSSRFES